ncbi:MULTISPECIES: hypothetical protein [unclassified Pseudomonas]|uniref:hypothetical protein n=1 Tax=unclassified Pseudomonas TaxID=196821 RepID=UPI0024561209|nr:MULTISPECIES: hypothetical protein [unclassified Pseudomonas]MDH4561272.1 hypothetical protein [Pseudomonas sp. BN411]MDH4871967.1 hypothetical protein [Pseudomonas sp. BN515]
MTIHHQAQAAISTLTHAFAPFTCHITAARNGNFSFTIVNEFGVARHSERLYPEHYGDADHLQNVIDRTHKALNA